MDKLEIRAVIKYQYLKGLKPKEIVKDLKETLAESAPSERMVYNWYNEFKRGRKNITDVIRSGRPIDVTTPENIQRVHRMILNDRKLKIREIAEIMHISYERVLNILHEHLDMKKFLSHWVPQVLTLEQKANRVIASEHGLALYKRNPNDFVSRIVIMDETWIHYYASESKQEISDCTEQCESQAKRSKTQKSAGKVLARIFWDSDGIIFIEYLEKERTITANYYIELLDRLNDKLKEKQKLPQMEKILFLHEDIPAHKSNNVMTKLEQLGYELILHSPYSPDLAPSDYYLLPNLKRVLQGKRFYSKDEIERETNAYFEGLSKFYYTSGIEKLEKRWTKCIKLKGDYVDE